MRISQSISFNLIATYSDGSIEDITNQAEYFTSNTQISSIIGNTLEALAEGTTTISATIGNVTSSSILITINKKFDDNSFDFTNFGYQYTKYIPADATKTNFDEKRFAMITGKVFAEDGSPLNGVKITIHKSPEYGSQTTDSTGQYIFAAEDGYRIIRYTKDGYTTIDRKIDTSKWSIVPDVTMLKTDSKVTTIDLNSMIAQTHISTPVIDHRGQRSTTLIFNNISKATVTALDGTTRELKTIDVRATEFKTLESMPADLPKETAYTYCSDITVDGVNDDEIVTFDAPVIMYVDNFLGFDIGEIIPVGYYDRNSGKWVCSDNGVVIILLDMDGDGKVDALDSTGDGNPNDLNGNGLYEDEVSGIPNNSIYSPGKTFWRAEITHFTPWDHNWPYGPPDDAENPENPDVDLNTPVDGCSVPVNSYIKPKSRVFHEDIPISGTDETLHYSSKRVDGYNHFIELSIDANNIPASVIGVEVKLSVAGRLFKQTLATNQLENIQFIWDGLDILGNQMQGETDAYLTVSYEYGAVYYAANSDFQRAWATLGSTRSTISTRRNIQLSTSKSLKLFSEENYKSFSKGWTLSNHNKGLYNTISMGNGESINSNKTKYFNTISTIVGDGNSNFSGDGNDAKLASLFYPNAIEIGNDKSIYIADASNNRVRRIDSSGIITTVAGNGVSGTVIDGTEATSAPIPRMNDIDIDTDGNLYIATCSEIFKVNTSGTISTIDTKGTFSCGGTRSIVADTVGSSPEYIETDKDGNIFVGTYHAVYKISPCGNIKRVVDNNSGAPTGIQFSGMSLDSKGNIYISTSSNYIYKVDTTGIMTIVAGNGNYEHSGDNGDAINASLKGPHRIMLDKEDNIYFTTDYGVRKIDTSNIITTLAGNGSSGYSGDGKDALNASFKNAQGLAVNDNTIYIADSNNHRIREVFMSSLLKKLDLNVNDYLYIHSDNTADVFDSSGKQIKTVNLSTANFLKEFVYDNQDNLLSIIDQFSNTTTITRDANTNPTSITAPNGQKTYLNVDENGNLISVQYEDGSDYQFEYDSASLMTKETDPNGNVFTHLFDENGRIYQDTDSIGGNWKFMKSGNAKTVTYSMTKPEGDETSSTDTKQSDGSIVSQMTLPSGDVISTTTSGDTKQVTTSKAGITTNTIYTIDTLNQEKILSSVTTTQPSGLNNQVVYTTNYDGTQIHSNSKTKTISSNSKTATIVSDYNNATETITTPESRVLKRDYDKDTLLTTAISSGTLNPITYEYDSKGRVIKESSGTRATNYSYDSKGNIATFTNAKGEVTNYTYDVMGRVTTVSYSNGTVENYKYDFNGNMTKLTTPTPSNFNFNYNGIDKRVSLTSPLNLTTSYTYNKNRNLSSIVRPSTKTITNTYTADRLTSTATPEGATNYTYLFADTIGSVTNGSKSITYGYDGELLTSLTQNGILNQSINYTYNNDFAVTSAAYAGKTTSLTYDNDRLLISSGDFTLSRDTANGYVTNISDGTISQNINYNNFGEISKVSDNTFTYELSQRDNSGAITQKRENINGVDTVYDYIYDNKARLTAVSKNNQEVENYTYDNNGNRLQAIVNSVTTQASYTLDDNLEVYGDNTYSYDADGYLVEKVTPNETTTYTYNTLGALTSVTTPTKTINYHLTALNQRVAKEVDGVITEKYLWANLTTLLAVYDGNDNLVQRFNYADNRMPISMTQDSQTYYLHYDQVGTLRAISDTNHNIIKEVTYDTFGNILEDTNKEFHVPFGFAGGLQDSDTGLVHFGYREHDPYTGKWTAKDPIDFGGGDSNLYGYVLGNPVGFVDPEGKSAVATAAIVGGALLLWYDLDQFAKKAIANKKQNPDNKKFIDQFKKDARDLYKDTIIPTNKVCR